jgi:hypothetical protein
VGAPKLRPGTGFHLRERPDGIEGRTDRSKWHRVLQWWGGHHLDRDDDGEWRDEGKGWGANQRAQVGPVRGFTRASRREDLALSAHAQALRAEAHTMGGREETAGYFGTGREHRGHGTERRVRVTGADTATDARELRTFAVTYTTGTDTRTTRVNAYTASSARKKVAARTGGTVRAVRRAL